MFRAYTLEERETWDSVVRSFPRYDVYWLSGYVKAFFLHGDGPSARLIFQSDVCGGFRASLGVVFSAFFLSDNVDLHTR